MADRKSRIIRANPRRDLIAQHRDRIQLPRASDELPNDRRVDDLLARGHPAHRVEELVHVGDPVLQQIAHPGAALLEQAQGEVGLEVLGQDQHAEARPVLGPERARRANPLVADPRRHPDIDDRKIGLCRSDDLHEGFGRAGLPGHLEASLDEQPDDALAEQDRVVSDDDLQHG